MGRKMNNRTPALANIAPPIRLWMTILCCRARKCSSVTLNLRSKIMRRESSLMMLERWDRIEEESSKRSHGSGWRREKSSRKKQLPRRAGQHETHAQPPEGPGAESVEARVGAGEGSEGAQEHEQEAGGSSTMPNPVATHTVSKVPLLTPNRTKLRCEQLRSSRYTCSATGLR